MARRIRVAGVPGDFRVPRGWPTPTDRWVRTNAFWVPPPEWTPTPGLRPAPAEWRFWSPNPLWMKSKGHLYTRLRVWSYSATAAVAVAVLSRIVTTLANAELLAVVTFGAFAVAVGCQLAFLIGHTRVTRHALDGFAVIAAENRRQRMTREYQRYLLDAG